MKIKLYFVKISNIIFGLPIYLIFIVIRPIISIKIGRLYSSRLGHLNYDVDNYIFTKKANNINEFSIFVCENYIANYEIYCKWNELESILLTKNFLYRNLIGFIEKFINNSSLLIHFEEMHHHTFASSSDQNIFLSDEYKKKGIDFLSRFGIKKPYVCFHNRDATYLAKTQKDGGDGNEHEFRDFEFDDYKDSIELLSKQNIQAVRIGELIQKKSKLKPNNLVSAVGEISNSHLISMIYHADYAITGTSGINQVSKTLRKPLLLVNYIPLYSDPTSMKEEFLIMFAPNTLIVPKKIYNKKDEKYLTLSEMLNLNYDYNTKNFFKNLELEIVNNTPTEIAEAVDEMNKRIKCKWQDNEHQKHLQNKFWKLFEDNENYQYLRYELKNNISSTFLSQNSFLLD